jgi:hypothetical protein
VSRYLHPEFGYFCPTPRLRGDLRLACCAGLFGVALGTIGAIVLNRIEHAVSPALPVSTAATQPGVGDGVPRQLANAMHNDPAAGAPKARLPAIRRDNGPELARIALGQPAKLNNTAPPSAPRNIPGAAGQAPAASSTAGAIAQSAAPRTQGAPPQPQRATVPAPNAKPQGALPAPSRPQKQHSEPMRASSGNANGVESAERAYARDSASPRTVFWDWSR